MNKCETYIESMDNPTRAGRVQEALVHLLFEINEKLESKKEEPKQIVEEPKVEEVKVETKSTPKKTTRKKKVKSDE